MTGPLRKTKSGRLETIRRRRSPRRGRYISLCPRLQRIELAVALPGMRGDVARRFEMRARFVEEPEMFIHDAEPELRWIIVRGRFQHLFKTRARLCIIVEIKIADGQIAARQRVGRVLRENLLELCGGCTQMAVLEIENGILVELVFGEAIFGIGSGVRCARARTVGEIAERGEKLFSLRRRSGCCSRTAPR